MGNLTDRTDEVRRILRKHDYVPVVRKVGDGVVITMPYPKLSRPIQPRFVEAYAIKRGKESGLFYNSNLNTDERFVSIPEHAIRLFIMSDVSACCSRVPISDSLVYYLDEGGSDHPNIECIVD